MTESSADQATPSPRPRSAVALEARGRIRLMLWGLAGIGYLILFAYYGYRTAILEPFSDQFDLISTYLDHRMGGDLGAYWQTPHANHRIPLYRLLVAADVEFFHASGHIYLVVAGLAIAALAALLCRWISEAAPQGLKAAAAVAAFMLLLSTANVSGVFIPFYTPAIHTVFFAVCAVFLVEPRQNAEPRLEALRRLAGFACACAAALGNAVGLVALPVIAFRAFRGGRADRDWLAAVLGLSGVFIALYIHPDLFDGGGESGSLALALSAADYFIGYLGLPWVRASESLGRVAGTLILLAALTAVCRKGGPGSARAERVATGLIAFSLATALLAAIGRRNAAVADDAPLRYAIYLAPLHIGLLCLILPWLEGLWRRRPRTIQAGFAFAACLLMVQQVAIGERTVIHVVQIRAMIARFDSGERAPEMATVIHPDLERADAVSRRMKRLGLK